MLFREASSILHQLDQLPAVARSQSDDPEGTVSAGIASSLAPALVGVLIQKSHAKIPKVKLKVSDDDSETLEAAVDGSSLDLAVVYEDEFVSKFSRQPLFRQQLFLVGKESEFSGRSSVSLDEVAKIPLALPGLPNARRGLIDRVFAERSLPMNVVAETDSVSSELFAVKAGLAHTILPVNDRRAHVQDGFAEPLAIDADLFLTCSVISSSDLPLTRAGEAVRQLITEFIDAALLKGDFMGLQRLG